MYNSLLYLESLDKYYYKKEDFNINEFKCKIKSNIIDSEVLGTFNLINWQLFKSCYDFSTIKSINNYLLDFGFLDYVTCYRFNNSYYQKTKRLKNRIEKLFSYDNLFFVTFTFDDKKLRKKDLSKYTQPYLRKKVTLWLKDNSIDYVGNIDFGGKKGRLHFHCIVASDKLRIDRKSWLYGALNVKRIVTKQSGSLSIYLNKLCSHALKESTKNQYLIYPKKKY